MEDKKDTKVEPCSCGSTDFVCICGADDGTVPQEEVDHSYWCEGWVRCRDCGML